MTFNISTNSKAFALRPSKWKIYRRYKTTKYEGVNGQEDVKIKGYLLCCDLSWQVISKPEYTNVLSLLTSLQKGEAATLVSITNNAGTDEGVITSSYQFFVDTEDITLNEGEFLPNTPMEFTIISKGIFND
jgi:hypothetical protein